MNSDMILEQFRYEAPYSTWLTGDYLRQLCKEHRKQIPCPKLPLSVGEHGWELLLECQGWQIYRQEQTNLVVILDPEHKTRAVGKRKQLLMPILYYIHAQAKLEKFRTRNQLKYGIVLCGGGGKGAFQIGVWKRLEELGVADRFTGISGASVGALNALLFAEGNYERAKAVWMDMKQGDLTRPNPELVKKRAAFMATFMATSMAPFMAAGVGGAAGVVSAISMTKLLSHLDKSAGVFTKEKIEQVAEQNISLDGLYNKLVYASVAVLSLPSPKHIGGWKLILRPEYVYLDTSSQDALERNIKKVMASATVPFAFSPEEMDGKYYFDGGTLDNEPAYPLVKAGFQNILVVHLDEENREKFDSKLRKLLTEEELRGVNIRHIWPRKNLKWFLLLNPKLTQMRMQAGYEAACEQLSESFFR